MGSQSLIKENLEAQRKHCLLLTHFWVSTYLGVLNLDILRH